MEGLRNFIKVDNHCALDVGHLNEGIRPFEVRRPKFNEECPETSIRSRGIDAESGGRLLTEIAHQ